jgi:hypothetical protein
MSDNDDHNFSTFLRLFKGQEDCFAQQGKDFYYPIKRPLNDFYISLHCRGGATFGIYMLTNQGQTHVLCFDLEIPKTEIYVDELADRTKKYQRLAPHLHTLLQILQDEYQIPESSLILEDTGGRGYHVWIFLATPIPGTVAIAFGDEVRRKLDFEVEFFPKEERLTPRRRYGNLIKLPLGIHRKYERESTFFTLNSEEPKFLDSLEMNLKILENIVPIHSLPISDDTKPLQGDLLLFDELLHDPAPEPERLYYSGSISQLLTQCSAMRQLSNKAEAGIRLTHNEAFYFANVMLSVDGGPDEIHRVLKQAYQHDYAAQETNTAINNILPLQPTSCRLLVNDQICSEYCKPTVRRQNEDDLLPNTNPCSVWLEHDTPGALSSTDDMLALIATEENVQAAFYKLRRHLADESIVLFDAFDFAFFENRLEEHTQVIAVALAKQMDLPFAGYLPFEVPKKLDETLVLQYRRMAYSTVFDQVPIQAVFNILGPVIDSQFQRSSFGNRWNLDSTQPHRIFDDWKHSYPQFRDGIMSALQEYPNGYHICCDIKRYFDNINLDILLQQLHNIVPDGYLHTLVDRIILSYEHEPGSKRGIPQGPPYSGLLANLYLNDFDRFVSSFAPGYFRYVDDFVIVFDSLKNAEAGLERIVRELSRLGLELSQDPGKNPAIIANSDITRVRRTLDKIRYGILENTREIRHVDTQTLNNFYDAVLRHSMSFDSSEQLIEINEALPSLLYVVSQETLISHPLKDMVIYVSDYLIRKHWFFPKRLLSVFERLLAVDQQRQKYAALFDYLEPAHKCYLLLAAYKGVVQNDAYRSLLEEILGKSITDTDPFVSGLSFSIANDPAIRLNTGLTLSATIGRFGSATTWFELMHFLFETDYMSLSLQERDSLRKAINQAQPEILRAVLLEKMGGFPETYLDEVYFRGLLSSFSVILLPGAVSLLVQAMNKSLFVLELENFLTGDPKVKAIAVSFLTHALSARIYGMGLAEMENIQYVLGDMPDPEINRAVLRVLRQNADLYDDQFSKSHRLLLKINRCYFFEKIDNLEEYSHLELIPEEVLISHSGSDVSSAKRAAEILSRNDVLPPLEFYYDSSKHEIRINYSAGSNYNSLDKMHFSIEDKPSVLRALRIAADAYKKAEFFRRTVRITPLISVENLQVHSGGVAVVFRTIAASLQTPLIISGIVFGEGETDIPRMVGLLLRDLLFDTESRFHAAARKMPLDPLSAFVVQMIHNMMGKEPSHRYSSLRFDYLVALIDGSSHLSECNLGILYLRERLRSALFRHNQGEITWDGVCAAVDEHVTHVHDICPPESLSKTRFKNRIFGSSYTKLGLHYLSSQFINIALNRQDILNITVNEPSYSDLIEYLLLISVISLEIVSLSRSLHNGNQRLYEYVVNGAADDLVPVQAARYTVQLKRTELVKILMYNPEQTGIDMKELSLQQVALLALLSLGGSVSSGTWKVGRPKGVNSERFDDFAHTCLYRIVRLEEELQKSMENLSTTLRDNNEPSIELRLPATWENLNVIVGSFNYIRRKVGVSRRVGFANGKKFPENITCTSRLHRKAIAKIDALPGIKLTNGFPSSRYRSSWDSHNNFVTNLVIPSMAIDRLLGGLTSGRLFGYKLSYIYSGKSMVIWDTLFLILITALAGLFKLGETTLPSGYWPGVFSIFGGYSSTIAEIFLLRIVWGLAYWVPALRKILDAVRMEWVRPQENQ